jgi:hypothetical protein
MGTKFIAAAATLAISFGSLSSAAFATDNNTPAEAGAKKAAKSDPSRRVCRNLTISGSRLTTRFCQTQAEWDRQAEKAMRNAMDQKASAGADITPIKR